MRVLSSSFFVRLSSMKNMSPSSVFSVAVSQYVCCSNVAIQTVAMQQRVVRVQREFPSGVVHSPPSFSDLPSRYSSHRTLQPFSFTPFVCLFFFCSFAFSTLFFVVFFSLIPFSPSLHDYFYLFLIFFDPPLPRSRYLCFFSTNAKGDSFDWRQCALSNSPLACVDTFLFHLSPFFPRHAPIPTLMHFSRPSVFTEIHSWTVPYHCSSQYHSFSSRHSVQWSNMENSL